LGYPFKNNCTGKENYIPLKGKMNRFGKSLEKIYSQKVI